MLVDIFYKSDSSENRNHLKNTPDIWACLSELINKLMKKKLNIRQGKSRADDKFF